MNEESERCKADQERLSGELDLIGSKQKELEVALGPLEESLAQLPPINYHQHVDVERDNV